MRMTDGVRKAIEAVDREVARLAAHTSTDDAPTLNQLQTSWGTLVELLALGPRPDRRACPHCGSIAMLDATRCGRCWMELVPPKGGAA